MKQCILSGFLLLSCVMLLSLNEKLNDAVTLHTSYYYFGLATLVLSIILGVWGLFAKEKH